MIITHWSYSKFHDLLHTLNVYKSLGKQYHVVDSWVADEERTLNVYQIPAKEHQVADSWAANEISVLEILFCKYLEYDDPLKLPNYKKLKEPKIVRFKSCSVLDVLKTFVETME